MQARWLILLRGIVYWLAFAAIGALLALLALLTGCAAEPPKQIVRTETVQVPVEVRVPIPAEYVQDRVVVEPKPAAGKYFTNGQVAIMIDLYREALKLSNTDKAALRQLNEKQP